MVLTSIGKEKHLPRWFARFFSVLQRLETGALEVTLPDGRVFAAQCQVPSVVSRWQETYWPACFRAVRGRLRPGRIASLQIITIDDRFFNQYRRGTDFIQKYIFPGGMLPSPSALRREFSVAGLEILGSLEFPDSYSRTLREWREAFNSRWGEVAHLGFDQRFHRMWNYYLCSCAACFSAVTTNVMQFALRRTP